MTEQHNIDSLFKSHLDAFESPVNPQVWSTVQAAMPQTVVTAATTSATVFTAKSLIIAASLIVAASSTYFYFNGNTSENKNVVAKTEEIAKQDVPTQTEEPARNEITLTQNENTEKASSGKNNNSAIEPIEEKIEKHTSVDNSIKPEKEIKPGVVDGGAKNSNNPPVENKPLVEPNVASKSNPQTKQTESPKPTDTKQPEKDAAEPTILNDKWDTEELASNIKINTDIITLNGDNLNDEFTLEVSNAKICNLIIYDRNGKVVIQYNTQTAIWNGKLKNGNDAADGTYFYFIFGESFDGRPFDKKGNLTIKK